MVADGGSDTSTTGEDHGFAEIDSACIKDLLEVVCALETSVSVAELADWDVDRGWDVASLEGWRWPAVNDLGGSAVAQVADVVKAFHIRGVELKGEVICGSGVSGTQWFSLALPFGKATVKDAHIRVSEGLKHEGCPVCEQAIALVVHNNAVALANVETLGNHAEVVLAGHHEGVRRGQVTRKLQVEEFGTTNVLAVEHKEGVFAWTHVDGAVEQAEVGGIDHLVEVIGGDECLVGRFDHFLGDF